jgi:hypothetical protein
MEQNEENKTYYSGNIPLSSKADNLPKGVRCKLCGCHTDAHNVYFKCPLLNDYICSECCQSEVPKPENLLEIQKHVECPTFQTVIDTCNKCGKNCLQE